MGFVLVSFVNLAGSVSSMMLMIVFVAMFHFVFH
jgi:hypothetical protein